MAKQLPNSFTAYELTTEEQLNGQILNTSQELVLQTEMSTIAEQLLVLDFDPVTPTKFAQDEAFLRGQLSVYRLLIDRSPEASQQLKLLAANAIQPQN